MKTIAQNSELLKHLFDLIEKHRGIFKQERSYQRAVGLLLAEIFVFARHTITQLIMALGMNEADWSAWYRLFSAKRFNYEQASAVFLRETLAHVVADERTVVLCRYVGCPLLPRNRNRKSMNFWLWHVLSRILATFASSRNKNNPRFRFVSCFITPKSRDETHLVRFELPSP